MAFGKKKRKIEELSAELIRLQEELENLKNERAGHISSLQSARDRLRESEVRNQEPIKELNNSNYQLRSELTRARHDLEQLKILSEKRESELLGELERFRKAEETSEKIAEQLFMTEEKIAYFIKESKILAVGILRKLKVFMDKYRFFKYELHLVPSKEIISEANKIFYPNSGNYSKEQIEEAQRRGFKTGISSGNIPDPRNVLQGSLINLLKIIKLIDLLAELTEKELVQTRTLIAADKFIEQTIRNYESLSVLRSKEYERYSYNPKGTRETTTYKKSELDDYIISFNKFEESALRALKGAVGSEGSIENLNETTIKIISEIITLLGKVRESLSSKAVGIFLPEYDKLQIGIIEMLDRLFNLVVNKINENELLAERLTQIEDENIKKAEDEFGIFLNRETSYERMIKAAPKRLK